MSKVIALIGVPVALVIAAVTNHPKPKISAVMHAQVPVEKKAPSSFMINYLVQNQLKDKSKSWTVSIARSNNGSVAERQEGNPTTVLDTTSDTSKMYDLSMGIVATTPIPSRLLDQMKAVPVLGEACQPPNPSYKYEGQEAVLGIDSAKYSFADKYTQTRCGWHRA